MMANEVPHVPWFFWVLCPRPGNAAGSTLPCRASVASSRVPDPGLPLFVTRWSPLLGSTPTEVPPRCLHQSCISLKKKIKYFEYNLKKNLQDGNRSRSADTGEDGAQVWVKFGLRSGLRAQVSCFPARCSPCAARFQLCIGHSVGLVTLLYLRGKHQDAPSALCH